MNPNAPTLMLAVLVASACSPDGTSQASEWRAERDTVGDTVIVRTVAGSVWGSPRRLVPELVIGQVEGAEEYLLGDVQALAVDDAGHIYAFDSQVPALRVYDADGTFLRTIGRQGEGPGEYRQPDGGAIVLLPDGRILLRDPGNARINVYSPAGETMGEWPIRGGSFTSVPMFSDADGNVYTYIWNLGGDRSARGLLRISPEGAPLDTLPVPASDYQPPTVSASVEGASQTWSVPFSPIRVWTWSPEGYYLGGVTTRYAFDLFRPGGPVLRIERVVEPVAVAAGEKAAEEYRVHQAMRRLKPDWRWNGPPIPDTKPPFQRLQVARDGRIWVMLRTPGREAPDATQAEPTGTGIGPRATGGPGESPPPPSWIEPVAFDVFESDGRYLGQVHAPDGLQTYPYPVLETDRVWAIVRDDMGVQTIVRFAIAEDG